MKIAAFSGSLMDCGIREAMEITAKLGLEGIEIACREPHLTPVSTARHVMEIGRFAEEYGLSIPALAGYAGHFSERSDGECEQALDDFRRLLEHASLLKSDNIRIFQGGPHAFMADETHYERAALWLRKCSEEARRYGKTILLEIHNASLVETPDAAIKLLDMIGEDNIGMIHDAGNMYITDTDYGKESVRQLGSRLTHVHVKDEKRIPSAGAPGTFANRTRHGMEHFLQCRLGEGEVDHRELFEALIENGYSGWITLECAAPFPPVERLAYDFEVVKRWLRETALGKEANSGNG
ncbi:sugar phosphate isomerase/epimerase family protein [Paenibacillus sp. DMB20]|uniref:sugar phosphate isomerase/epimerase family protein n=1 Tax=Paenibacillus sp. DMB20 TaxID=1642570 RepID=UPI000627A76C|nr:sugar phosphate isomerase/epimerase [Paenibacillus sp. DMB20]KKO51249.1 xylose isomerase [Paenibacillus sp. DMB20]